MTYELFFLLAYFLIGLDDLIRRRRNLKFIQISDVSLLYHYSPLLYRIFIILTWPLELVDSSEILKSGYKKVILKIIPLTLFMTFGVYVFELFSFKVLGYYIDSSFLKILFSSLVKLFFGVPIMTMVLTTIFTLSDLLICSLFNKDELPPPLPKDCL